MTNFGKLSNFCKDNKYTLYVIAHFQHDSVIVEVHNGRKIVKDDKHHSDIEQASEFLCSFFGLESNTSGKKPPINVEEEEDDCF